MTTWHTKKINWLEILANKRVLRPCLSPNAVLILKDAVTSGGYVAGGFARIFAYALLTEELGVIDPQPLHQDVVHVNKSNRDAWQDIKKYLGDGYEVDPTQKRWVGSVEKMRLWKAGVGDIDVFFLDSSAASKSIDMLASRKLTWSGHTIAGYGFECVVDKRNILQFITKVTGSPEAVLSTFDITNAMVYLDADGLHYTDEWLELETHNQLGINKSDRPNLLWRINKWANKHSYSKLRPGDEDKYVDALLSAYQKAKSAGIEWKMWDRKVTSQAVANMGWKFKDWLPPAELLKASLLFDSYRQIDALRVVSKKLGGVDVKSCQLGPSGP
jgi:hypothetical protein